VIESEDSSRASPLLLRQLERGRRAAEEARQTLLLAHLHIVDAIAQQYHNSRISKSELIHAGRVGVLRAADLFQYRHGYGFSTFAGFWIRQSIRAVPGTVAIESGMADVVSRRLIALPPISRSVN
jgi:RNA polymerase primary sigma factor